MNPQVVAELAAVDATPARLASEMATEGTSRPEKRLTLPVRRRESPIDIAIERERRRVAGGLNAGRWRDVS